jgi:hypothetical protein
MIGDLENNVKMEPRETYNVVTRFDWFRKEYSGYSVRNTITILFFYIEGGSILTR